VKSEDISWGNFRGKMGAVGLAGIGLMAQTLWLSLEVKAPWEVFHRVEQKMDCEKT